MTTTTQRDPQPDDHLIIHVTLPSNLLSVKRVRSVELFRAVLVDRIKAVFTTAAVHVNITEFTETLYVGTNCTWGVMHRSVRVIVEGIYDDLYPAY